MSDFKEVKKRGGAVAGLKYPAQHQKLLEMGFESALIVDALETAKGDLEVATALMFGETPVSSIATPKVVVPPMRVVGSKQSSSAAKVVPKQDIKEIHNKFMAMYKVQKCKEKGNHDKRMCIYYHSNGDRRRNPFQILYTCLECPNVLPETQTCPEGDVCLKAHNMLERMFHPELFKISYCQRGANGQQCDRGNLCAFAHSDEDHRIPMSQTLAKQAAANGSSPNAVSASSQDPMQVGKAMTVDSKQLDSIQDKLIRLIRSQGTDGIISSELPKRYFDAYSERLELADEAGEKFRIKDLLLAHPCISVVMHKGVQPRYVYEEVVAASIPAPTVTSASTSVPAAPVKQAGISYAALASGTVSYSSVISGASKPTPAAPVVEATPAPVVAAPVASTETASSKSSRRRGPAESDAVSAAPAVHDYSAAAVASTPSPVVAGGGRRRGPDVNDIPTPEFSSGIGPLLTAGSLDDLSTLRQQINSLQNSLDLKSSEVERVSENFELEVRKRDQLIAQLRQEKAAELNQFRHNISLIENALIETQRQESIYINEISLHDTINKSSRARDDLTKFVNILKLQLVSRISASESQFSAPATNVTKSSLSTFLNVNGINNLNGAAPEVSTTASSTYLPVKTVAAAEVVHSHVHADNFAQNSAAVTNGHIHHNSSLLMCSLPGCGLEGSFICSACGKAGYCGADHQREHWVSHINDCTP